MDNGYECISVDLGSGQSKVQWFPRKRPGPGRYMALYSRSHIIIDFCPRMTLTPPHGMSHPRACSAREPAGSAKDPDGQAHNRWLIAWLMDGRVSGRLPNIEYSVHCSVLSAL